MNAVVRTMTDQGDAERRQDAQTDLTGALFLGLAGIGYVDAGRQLQGGDAVFHLGHGIAQRAVGRAVEVHVDAPLRTLVLNDRAPIGHADGGDVAQLHACLRIADQQVRELLDAIALLGR